MRSVRHPSFTEICFVIFIVNGPTNQQTDTGENKTSQAEVNTGGKVEQGSVKQRHRDRYLPQERLETKPELKEE